MDSGRALHQHQSDNSSGTSTCSASLKHEASQYDSSIYTADSSSDCKSQLPQSDPSQKGSSLSAFLNTLCLAIGVGVLQLSYTVKQSGWFGTSFIVLAGAIGFLNAAITIKCIYLKRGGGRIANYHDIGHEAFGTLGYYVISAFNIVNIIGSIGIYAILAANNTSNLLVQVNVHISTRILMIATTAVICMPTLFTKTLAETLLVSLIGTATSVIVAVIIVAMACLYPIRNGEIHAGGDIIRTGTISHAAVVPGGFAMALSSVNFAYVGTTIVPHIEGSMRRPEKFNMVFGSALAIITALYVVMGATGYWAYGDQTLSPITLNFPKPLVILAISEAIPFFDDVISLVGALTNPVLIYLAPIACYVKLKGWKNCSWLLISGLVLLLAFGMTVSAFGLVQTILDIMKAFRNAKQ
ncbi:hypothetical protein GGF46_004639 [Coemansia sp. RSA 552]|nr:hypothetical protein GGF46_004639 [Coemansia sp. RSA 552]